MIVDMLYNSLDLPIAALLVAVFLRTVTFCLASDWIILIGRPLPVPIVVHSLWAENTEHFSFRPFYILGSIAQGFGWGHIVQWGPDLFMKLLHRKRCPFLGKKLLPT
jgi:hypothetical protein